MRSRLPRSLRTSRTLGKAAALGVVLVFAGLCAALALSTGPESSARGSLSTPERLRLSAWWPTKSADPGLYVGTATCAECHAGIVRQQAKSQMFRTFGAARDSAVLAHDQPGTYRNGEYSYHAALAGHAAVMDVRDAQGKQQRADLKWFFGSGDVGQSFLWQDGGGFHETRFNYFRSINALAATPGRLSAPPTYFGMAVGRSVEPFEVRSCLSCHTTQYPAAGPITDAHLVGGIQCEACHGPGAAHVAAAREHTTDAAGSDHAGAAGSEPAAPWDRKIFNVARLAPVDAVDGCGACHSTPSDARLMGAAGVESVRFPAYRLEKSVCWGQKGDARLICSSCHDPHAPLEHDPAAYDSVCQSCHMGVHPATVQAASIKAGGRVAAVCPVAKTKCVSCHMPKYQIPEMHAAFTDHRIQINRIPAKFLP